MQYSLKQLRAILECVDMRVKKTDCGEYRVNFPNGTEASAYYTNDATDAIYTARDMRARANAASFKRAE